MDEDIIISESAKVFFKMNIQNTIQRTMDDLLRIMNIDSAGIELFDSDLVLHIQELSGMCANKFDSSRANWRV